MEGFLVEFKHLRIPLEEIKSATNNFHSSKRIGRGGFGFVYKGVVSHSKGQSMVAFKRLDRKFGQGDSEFWKEILMLSRYTHENLISLLGFCDEDGEKIVVYELASHGSLDLHLGDTSLTWRQRVKMCIGAATGLCHLHDPKETQERVIHRDIKSSNILLDEHWNAKVSDLGLSKIGPANQRRTFLFATNVVGTFGYLDPLYLETSILTKESDVYSFGVVLFEVLTGRLCFENKNGNFQSLVRMWKRSYKQRKVGEIIFQNLKQQMDPRSLETFLDIAYGCLKKSREERPKMSQVVEKLYTALRFQEEMEQPMKYEDISKTAVPPLVYRSKKELYMLLSRGILVNGGNTWFSLNENGEHCEMISATECLTCLSSTYQGYAFYPIKSRFEVDDNSYHREIFTEFKTHVKTQFLSPNITYAVNLLFNFFYSTNTFDSGIQYRLAGETHYSTSHFRYKREDGWLTAELYQFTCDRRYVDLEITFVCKDLVVVDGIEFQPLSRVGHQVIEDEEVDTQTDTNFEQKLPSDYEDIIHLSKCSLQWRTKKELYYVLCKGFPIKNGQQWFSLAKSGKKCLMFSAGMTLERKEWRWRSEPKSRFDEVAFDPLGTFSIKVEQEMLLPKTIYATYLVYRLEEKYYGSEPPIHVKDGLFNNHRYQHDYSWYLFLRHPQTPIIRPKVYENTHNPSNIPKMKGLPKQRDHDWMEVQICEFHPDATNKEIRKSHLLFDIPDYKLLRGLFVLGIEFRPIYSLL